MLLRLVVVGVWIAALGCADATRLVRKATYPPSFHYITQEEIHGTMSALAYQVNELDEIMWRPGGLEPGDRERILSILTEMQLLAGQLKQGTRSNHPRIDRDAPRLQVDVERALEGARSDPPNYFFAGVVYQSCAYCHEARHEALARGAAQPEPRVGAQD
jgi:hypothetical protein